MNKKQSCPTCNAEMKILYAVSWDNPSEKGTLFSDHVVYWCHECGTLVDDGGLRLAKAIYVPKRAVS